MTKLFAAVIIMLIMNIAQSQSSSSQMLLKPVVCDQKETIIDNLELYFNEQLQFVYLSYYQDLSTLIAMYQNRHSGTWTLIEYSDDPVFENLACILAHGTSLPL